jgi:hypothetical protein
MDLNTAIPLVAANVVAIVAIFVGWQQAKMTLDHNRALTDLDAVRTVLDEVAIQLFLAHYALFEMVFAAKTPINDTNRTKAEAMAMKLKAAGESLSELTARLKLRVPEGEPVVSNLVKANSVALDSYHYWNRALAATSQPPEAVRRKVETFSRLFEAHQNTFMEAARKIAGARLSAELND